MEKTDACVHVLRLSRPGRVKFGCAHGCNKLAPSVARSAPIGLARGCEALPPASFACRPRATHAIQSLFIAQIGPCRQLAAAVLPPSTFSCTQGIIVSDRFLSTRRALRRLLPAPTDQDMWRVLIQNCHHRAWSSVDAIRGFHVSTWPSRLSRLSRARPNMNGTPHRRPMVFRIRTPSIGLAIGFVLTTSALAFTSCAAWSTHSNERLFHGSHSLYSLSSLLGVRRNSELLVQDEHAERWARGYHRLAKYLQAFPLTVRQIGLDVYEGIADAYMALPTYQQAAVPLVALNTAVFVASLLSPALGTSAWMQRYFVHRPSSGRVITLLTSVSSHQWFPHFLFNNIALWSVGSSAIQALPRNETHENIPEADTFPQFLAFYISAGLFASLASHLAVAFRWRLPSLTPAERARLSRRSSLGASGAIYAAFALCACTMPQVQLR